MNLRKQLLLISLATLILPWAGCEYAREMEDALRQGQQNALLGSAAAVANALAVRPELLYREQTLAETPPNTSSDIYAYALRTSPVLDGYIADWGLEKRMLRNAGITIGSPYGFSVGYLAGIFDRYLHLFIQVRDSDVVWLSPDGGTDHDRVLLALTDQFGALREFVFESAAPGRVTPRAIAGHSETATTRELRITAQWLSTAEGYNLEVQLPLQLVGARLGFAVIDSSTSPWRSSGTLDPGRRPRSAPGVLVYPSASLSDSLRAYHDDGKRLVVTDRYARVVGQSGSLGNRQVVPRNPRRGALTALAERLFRSVLKEDSAEFPRRGNNIGRIAGPEVTAALGGEPASVWYRGNNDTALVSAASPIRRGGEVLGAVVMEQNSDAILTLTNQALSRLLGLTLLASFAAAGALLGYATVLSLRVRRLRNATESAVRPDGTLQTKVPGTGARDEIGDLARSFQTLLDRLDEYTDYLRTVAGKLSHELRTPLAVVRSSLENLDAESLPDDARIYATRARDGAERLRIILSAMSEATRVEETIRGADSELFDLRELVENAGSAYRDVYTRHALQISVPQQPCPVFGVGELIVQMLDKLMDNAADFSAEDMPIRIRLETDSRHHRLSVENSGPLLAEKMRSRLFDSMVTVRERGAAAKPARLEAPHLGLGLNIVRLIVEFHRGKVSANNLPDGSGVVFVVELPAARS